LCYAEKIENLASELKLSAEEKDAKAAVALILKKSDKDLETFFVKRIENSKDPWSGQMALPGGKRAKEDQSLKQTVVREILEETKINLLQCCHFLGVMSAMSSVRVANLKVLPFIFVLEHEPSIVLNSRELESYVWIPLRELIRHRGFTKFSFGKSPAYIIGNYTIWGLTYRILEDFIQILEK